jgi:PEP-CTERM motif
MNKFSVACALLMAAIICSQAATVVGSTIPPTSFPAGATEYEILFVTSGTVSPASGTLSTYNAFVTAQANAAGSILPSGLTWNAVVSTQVITQAGIIRTIHNFNAASNAPSAAGIPVYNANGQLITNLGLYSNTQISSMPEYNQFGSMEQTAVATGSNGAGTFDNPLGTSGAWNVGQSSLGGSAKTAGQWINSTAESGANAEFAIYALSAPILIRPTITPEPTTLTLLATGVLGYCGYRRLRRRTQKPPDDTTDQVA